MNRIGMIIFWLILAYPVIIWLIGMDIQIFGGF
jgi:hypothetical protein